MGHVSALEAIGAARVLPVLRAPDVATALDQARRVLAAGLGVVELTATTPGWAHALATLREEAPSAIVGTGTVTDAATAEAAIDAGSAFLVSPHAAPAVRAIADRAGVPFLEGALSPTELAAVLAAGGAAKLFPAHVGGPAYLRSILAVMPGARIVPTGGIRLGDVPEWLDAGAFAVGVGSDLVSGDIEARLRAVLGGRIVAG
jgi:2-dehydro-3-deoxyphosphogluconate aldolase/(4S)-4-hydroxy-2-oxoglutarate aldolase